MNKVLWDHKLSIPYSSLFHRLKKIGSVALNILVAIADTARLTFFSFTRKFSQVKSTAHMLRYFNSYFPNVVVVGDINSKEGRETLLLLKHLGVAHRTEKQYDRSKVPIALWSKLLDEVDPKIRETLISKINDGTPLTSEETIAFKQLSGAAACFLLHRRVILDTIEQYDKLSERLKELESQPYSLEKVAQMKGLEKERDHYKSIFVFEHNARFGSVRRDGTVDLSPATGKECERVLKALPKKWEYFSLCVLDCAPHIDLPSSRIPGTSLVSSETPLVHPGFGISAKSYAFSHRSYPDLKRLFSEIREDGADREFYPIDVEFHRLSCQQSKTGRLYHLASVPSLIYRVACSSFHARGPDSYASKNLGSQQYLSKETPNHFQAAYLKNKIYQVAI